MEILTSKNILDILRFSFTNNHDDESETCAEEIFLCKQIYTWQTLQSQ